ncbi:MAG: hypothetical protein IKN12_11025 [Selenomonadaceae bacterium]|nr:hypothetical protein [Selenomonadaceae bacterium]
MIGLVLALFVGMCIGAFLFDKMTAKSFFYVETQNRKLYILYKLMFHWVLEKQKGRNLTDYLIERDYKSIAIYGMNYVGQALMGEIFNRGITVKYGIDQNADDIFTDVKIYKPIDNLEAVDVVVVTPITHFEQIKKVLSEKMKCPIISIEDLVYDIRV